MEMSSNQINNIFMVASNSVAMVCFRRKLFPLISEKARVLHVSVQSHLTSDIMR